jgi:hypothetical protein
MPTTMAALLAAATPLFGQARQPSDSGLVRVQVRVEGGDDLKDRIKPDVREPRDERRGDLDDVRVRVQPEVRLRGLREMPGIPGVFEMRLRAGEMEMEKAAYVGVATAPVPPALRPHLDLPKGVGLVVERVEDQSPAKAAGLQQYDVLHKLDDQLLMNTDQFSALVRTHEAGDVVTLHVIRAGKPVEVKVTLAEKDVPVQGNRFEFRLPPGFSGELPMLPEGRIDVLRDLEDDLPAVIGRLKASQNAQIVVSDTEHTLKVVVKDGKRTLTATDPDGTVLHEGPIDTPQQVEALPEAIRAKVQRMTREVPLLVEPPMPPAPPAPPAPSAPSSAPQPTN